MAPENVVVALKQLARIDGIKTPATILADGFKYLLSLTFPRDRRLEAAVDF